MSWTVIFSVGLRAEHRSPSRATKKKPRRKGGNHRGKKGRKGSHVTRYPAGRPPDVGCSERRAQGRKARLALFLFLSVSLARRAQTSPSEGRRLKEGRRDDVCGGAAPPGRAHRDGRLRVVVLLLFLNVVPPVPRWTTTTHATTTASMFKSDVFDLLKRLRGAFIAVCSPYVLSLARLEAHSRYLVLGPGNLQTRRLSSFFFCR